MLDRYRIIILPEATADLEAVFTHIKNDSPQNARAVARRLVDSIDSLDLLPRRYEVWTSHRDPHRVVRSMAVPPYIIYYRVSETQQVVTILNIRHGSRRQPKRFK